MINDELSKESTLSLQRFNTTLYKSKYRVLGVKIPFLRQYAKKLTADQFYEIQYICIEDILLACLLLKHFKGEELKERISYILSYTDSWAVTDLMASVVKVMRDDESYFPFVEELIKDRREYYVRAGLVILLFQYKDLRFIDTIFFLISEIKIHSYYVDMAIAWLLCSLSFKDERVFGYVDKLNQDIIRMFKQKRRDSIRERRNRKNVQD